MLRIIVSGPFTRVMVHLDGKLIGPWVEEARAAISAVPTSGPVSINLKNLTFADDAGIQLLRCYRDSLIELVGASAWIDRLLAGDPQTCPIRLPPREV